MASVSAAAHHRHPDPVIATLVLSAWEPELAPLRPLVSRLGRGQLALATVGVGAVDAAIGASQAIALARPKRVVFVGTAGVYRRGHATPAVGSAMIADRVYLVSTAVVRRDGYLPPPMVTETVTSPVLAAALGAITPGPVPTGTVACPLAITRTATLGRLIAQATGATLENLEAFAVIRAATMAGIEATAAVLGVANRVGPRAHPEWQANHLAASHAACKIVWGMLAASRPPLR
jgi:nucleoside phosphorylase